MIAFIWQNTFYFWIYFYVYVCVRFFFFCAFDFFDFFFFLPVPFYSSFSRLLWQKMESQPPPEDRVSLLSYILFPLVTLVFVIPAASYPIYLLVIQHYAVETWFGLASFGYCFVGLIIVKIVFLWREHRLGEQPPKGFLLNFFLWRWLELRSPLHSSWLGRLLAQLAFFTRTRYFKPWLRLQPRPSVGSTISEVFRCAHESNSCTIDQSYTPCCGICGRFDWLPRTLHIPECRRFEHLPHFTSNFLGLWLLFSFTQPSVARI